jgi:hypothetical protein
LVSPLTAAPPALAIARTGDFDVFTRIPWRQGTIPSSAETGVRVDFLVNSARSKCTLTPVLKDIPRQDIETATRVLQRFEAQARRYAAQERAGDK